MMVVLPSPAWRGICVALVRSNSSRRRVHYLQGRKEYTLAGGNGSREREPIYRDCHVKDLSETKEGP